MAEKTKQNFIGRWRITWMELWDQDFIDEEVEGFFEFGPKETGEFRFGYIRGEIDYRLTARDGEQSVEFSWEGSDEMEPTMGRGWAVAKGDELNGTIFFHQGDDSAFKCCRTSAVK